DPLLVSGIAGSSACGVLRAVATGNVVADQHGDGMLPTGSKYRLADLALDVAVGRERTARTFRRLGTGFTGEPDRLRYELHAGYQPGVGEIAVPQQIHHLLDRALRRRWPIEAGIRR